MYKASYLEVAADDPRQARYYEGKAFDRIIGSLRIAEAAGRGSEYEAEALDLAGRFWSVLLEDLSHKDNLLPDALRARLISIGLWVLTEIESLRAGRSLNVAELIEINATVREGLR